MTETVGRFIGVHRHVQDVGGVGDGEGGENRDGGHFLRRATRKSHPSRSERKITPHCREHVIFIFLLEVHEYILQDFIMKLN